MPAKSSGLRFCGAQGLSVDAWIEETISGTVEVGRRSRGSILDGAELAVSVMLLAFIHSK